MLFRFRLDFRANLGPAIGLSTTGAYRVSNRAHATTHAHATTIIPLLVFHHFLHHSYLHVIDNTDFLLQPSIEYRRFR
jgi:hypothetical protein